MAGEARGLLISMQVGQIELPKLVWALKFFIKKWGRGTFGSLQKEVDKHETLIDVYDSLEEIDILNSEDYAARELARINHKKASLNLARKWFSRSKGQWLAEGEKIQDSSINMLLISRSLSVMQSIMLEKPFEESEVKNVIWNFGKNKSPRPDGYTMELFKAVPISLIGGIYKIISKLLADTLKQVLPSIISEFQGAFVDSRKISDGILIASELIDSKSGLAESI
ncbi:uncharacterized protein LOC113271937 [Papaver somniferum]|uniref:uncharacterized protein LOC113271937 n=1 Tax=Papaver somniferum TaxID=3469 RepID=UPI000E6FDC4E|nr:uncharacterized protein LOC113271937 [Papaver somniferum]